MHRLAKALLPALALLCSACTAPLAYHSTTQPQGDAHVTRIDAKNRLLLSAPVKKETSNTSSEPVRRFCAEPAPDVFTALAASLSLDASTQTTSAAEKAAALRLAGSLAENATTIERTQTINILREMMYRNCERYLSGGISDTEFIIQAARDQRTIVQVLAIEQLTGVYRAQATALNATAQASRAGGDAIKAVADAYDRASKLQADADTAGTKAKSARSAADAEKASLGMKCDALPTAATDTIKDDDIAAKKTKCDDAAKAEAAATKAETAAKDAQAHYKRLANALDTTSGTAGSTQADGKASGGATGQAQQKQGNNDGEKPQTSTNHIANVVFQIVQENNNFNEMDMACIVQFRSGITDKGLFLENCVPLLRELSHTRVRTLQVNPAAKQ